MIANCKQSLPIKTERRQSYVVQSETNHAHWFLLFSKKSIVVCHAVFPPPTGIPRTLFLVPAAAATHALLTS